MIAKIAFFRSDSFVEDLLSSKQPLFGPCRGGKRLNLKEKSCCRFAADGEMSNHRHNESLY
jgi:hypothetical protein